MTPVGRVRTDGAGVRFLLDRHKRLVTPGLSLIRRSVEDVWGLRGVTVELGPGEGVALIGPSGSGKSTLLRLLAGVLPADEGTVEVHGRVGSLLSIEAGLVQPLTGRENAECLGVLAGMSQDETAARLDQVRELSGLGPAFDRPVVSWSQGMRARLGYAVARAVEPDVLLLDEVLEALDHEFRMVVAEHAHEVVARGGLVVAAGHDHDMLRGLCRRALWMSGGHVRRDGPFGEVVAAYAA